MRGLFVGFRVQEEAEEGDKGQRNDSNAGEMGKFVKHPPGFNAG